jgi:hypothetical protein
MRCVYEHWEEVRAKGRRAAQGVRRDFTYHHTARRIIQILEEQG